MFSYIVVVKDNKLIVEDDCWPLNKQYYALSMLHRTKKKIISKCQTIQMSNWNVKYFSVDDYYIKKTIAIAKDMD